jgi:hypothetical protein
LRRATALELLGGSRALRAHADVSLAFSPAVHLPPRPPNARTHARAHARTHCGRGEPSRDADVAGMIPVPVQQMWVG